MASTSKPAISNTLSATEQIKNNVIEYTIKAVMTVAKVVKDVQNFNVENKDELVVVEANYISSYRGKTVIKFSDEYLNSFAIFERGLSSILSKIA